MFEKLKVFFTGLSKSSQMQRAMFMSLLGDVSKKSKHTLNFDDCAFDFIFSKENLHSSLASTLIFYLNSNIPAHLIAGRYNTVPYSTGRNSVKCGLLVLQEMMVRSLERDEIIVNDFRIGVNEFFDHLGSPIKKAMSKFDIDYIALYILAHSAGCYARILSRIFTEEGFLEMKMISNDADHSVSFNKLINFDFDAGIHKSNLLKYPLYEKMLSKNTVSRTLADLSLDYSVLMEHRNDFLIPLIRINASAKPSALNPENEVEFLTEIKKHMPHVIISTKKTYIAAIMLLKQIKEQVDSTADANDSSGEFTF